MQTTIPPRPLDRLAIKLRPKVAAFLSKWSKKGKPKPSKKSMDALHKKFAKDSG